jgi:hypothetical protein
MENKKQNTLSRRKFVGRVGTATAAFTIVPKNVISGLGYKQPSDLLNIAAIGVGNRGGWHYLMCRMFRLLPEEADYPIHIHVNS